MTCVLLVTDTATQFTASVCPTSTCASLPPVACHTFKDISREPVIIYKLSAVIVKQVISSECDTVYFSSSRVSDQIFNVLSPFVETYGGLITCKKLINKCINLPYKYVSNTISQKFLLLMLYIAAGLMKYILMFFTCFRNTSNLIIL